MKLVIDIPDYVYCDIQAYKTIFDDKIEEVAKAIKYGTLLSREHGDLVDRDEINNRFNAICDELESLSNKPTHKELLDKLSMCLDTAKPVIENNYEDEEEELCR